MENPIRMDDLGVPLLLESPIKHMLLVASSPYAMIHNHFKLLFDLAMTIHHSCMVAVPFQTKKTLLGCPRKLVNG